MAEKVDNKNTDYKRDPYRPDRAHTERGGRVFTPKTPDKSPFQKVMDETGHSVDQTPFTPSGQTSKSETKTETREAVRFAASQQERYGKEKDPAQRSTVDKERDRSESAKTSESRDSGAPRAKEAEKRVIARGSTSGKKGEGGGEGGQQGGEGMGKGQGQKGKGFAGVPGELIGTVRSEAKGVIHGSFEMELLAVRSLTSTAAKPQRAPEVLSKAVLDQIVQYCRLTTKTDGDKELEMQLHEVIFKGLKIRVSVTEGKVDATFVTQSEEVKKLFNSQKNEIRKALAEKGIEVKNINVIVG